MNQLTDEDKRPGLYENVFAKAEKELGRAASPRKAKASKGRPAIGAAPDIPVPGQWGTRVVRDMPLEAVFQHLYKKELFRLSWGAKNASGEEWEKLEQEFEQRLARMQKEALADGWLKPQGVYGYWPAQAEGDALVVYEPESLEGEKPIELTRFGFPRQESGEALCLADYFASVESGKMDTVALQVVTVGEEATERFDELQAAEDYSEAYFAHGLAVQTAEAAAEYLHRHVLRELKLPESRGKRYSWGYPAIPDLDDHEKLFKLLPAEKELGMTLTAAFQLVPEQSTAAIIVHHPEAKYYSVGESRVEQLLKA